MAYSKWRLGHGDKYQTMIAAREAARMLHSWANDCCGTFAIACEAAGMDDWDDVIAFYHAGTQVKTRHLQVKRQYGDFRAESLLSLFKTAQNVLGQLNPYEGIVVPQRNRSFSLVFPVISQEVKVSHSKSLQIGDLASLCAACDDTSARSIAGNQGKNLPSAQRDWLEAVAKVFDGDFTTAASVIARFDVLAMSEDQARREVDGIVEALYARGPCALGLLEKLLRAVVPEGRLQVRELLHGLMDAEPKKLVRPILIAARGDDIVVEGISNSTVSSDIAADEIVRSIWDKNDHRELRVSFHSNGARGSHSSFARLMLHATSRPTRVFGQPQWHADLLCLTASTTGGNEREQGGLEMASYRDAARKDSPIEIGLCSKSEMTRALADAMDKHILEGADAYCDSRIGTETQIAEGLRNVREVFRERRRQLLRRMLQGWWEDNSVDGLVRAGPCATERIGSIILALAVLWSQKKPLREAEERNKWAIAEFGDLEVRASAMERYSRCSDEDGTPCRCEPEEIAQRLLGPAALVLLSHGNEELILEFANSPKLAGAGDDSFQKATCPTVVINAADLVKRAKFHGSERARAWLEEKRSKSTNAHRTRWNAAVEEWGDSDA